MTSTIAPDSKISVASFAKHCHEQMIPVNGSLRYFSVIPLEDGDLQRLVYDPAATTPPKTREILPNLNLVVVGYRRSRRTPAIPRARWWSFTGRRRIGSSIPL
ncbi:MAG: hypothetical protein R2724_28355 [Bryobacterales bacterium]